MDHRRDFPSMMGPQHPQPFFHALVRTDVDRDPHTIRRWRGRGVRIEAFDLTIFSSQTLHERTADPSVRAGH